MNQNSIQEIKNKILSNRKRQMVHKYITSLKFSVPIFYIPISDSFTTGEITVHVRNEKCKKITCLFDINEIAKSIQQEISQNGKYQMVKCQECNAYLEQNGFYVDQDMEDAINKLKSMGNGIYEEAVLMPQERYEVGVTKKNEWILRDKELNKNTVLKESDMLTEYEKNYPTYDSKQTSQFYENKWVFVHQNINILDNSLFQAVLYLFFPSLPNQRWKQVIIYESVKENKQTYFQKYMSVAKMFNKSTGQHSIIASGGFGHPEKAKYETRTFMVPLFTDDPQTQVQKEVDLIKLPPMNVPRVFHQLINHEGKVYAIGGYQRDFVKNTDISLKSCERFDQNTKKWEMIPDLDHPRQLFCVLSYKKLLYIIGGKTENNSKQEEDTSIEYFDVSTNTWTNVQLFQKQNPEKYFTERSYCFAKENSNTLVVFGGRKDISMSELIPCQRSRQAAELDLNTGLHKITQDLLPVGGISFEDVSDFQGAFYNNRYIFGFKKIGMEDRKDYFQPFVCKYFDSPNSDKFLFEGSNKIYRRTV